MTAEYVRRSPDLDEEILDRIASGETMASICREPGMPSRRGVRKWIDEDPVFAEKMKQARLDGFDAIAEDTREIARGGDGSSKDAYRDKLIVDTDLKLLAKWDRARYGEHFEVTVPTDPDVSKLTTRIENALGSLMQSLAPTP